MKKSDVPKDGFIIYKSFYDPIAYFPDDQFGRLMRAVFLWQRGEEVSPEPDIKVAFNFFVHQFLIDNEKYQKRCDTNSENIKKRWERERDKDTNEYNRIRTNTNHSDNDNGNDNDNDNERIERAKASPSARSLKRFVKPTLKEVEDYCKSRGTGIDAAAFFDFYESKGWVVGKSPMKNWKASVHTWERREKAKSQPQPTSGEASGYSVPENSFD